MGTGARIQFTAKEEVTLQGTIDKVAKMVVARVSHQKQQSIFNYFSLIGSAVFPCYSDFLRQTVHV